TSSGGSFRNTADTANITSVTVLSGSSTASFKYKDTLAGTPTITVSGTGVATGTQTETVNPSDTAPPTTTPTPSVAPNANGWNNTNVTVTLSATDNSGGSGVSQTFYELDGGSQQTYTGGILLSTEAIHTVQYWSTDNAGNTETAHTLTVRIDKTA